MCRPCSAVMPWEWAIVIFCKENETGWQSSVCECLKCKNTNTQTAVMIWKCIFNLWDWYGEWRSNDSFLYKCAACIHWCIKYLLSWEEDGTLCMMSDIALQYFNLCLEQILSILTTTQHKNKHSPRCSQSCPRCSACCHHWTCTRPGTPWNWWQRAPCHCKNKGGRKLHYKLHPSMTPHLGKGSYGREENTLYWLIWTRHSSCSTLTLLVHFFTSMNYKTKWNDNIVLSVLVSTSLPTCLNCMSSQIIT